MLQMFEKTLDQSTLHCINMESKSSTFGKVFKYLPEILYNQKQILNFL